MLRGHGAALRPGGRLALTAFSAYFQVRYHIEARRSTPTPASTTSAPRCATRRVTAAEVDLWTACFTPRELRLLARRPASRVDAIWSPSSPAPTRARRPTSSTPSCSARSPPELVA